MQSITPARKSEKKLSAPRQENWERQSGGDLVALLAGDAGGLAPCVKGKHAGPHSGVQERALGIQTPQRTHLHMQMRAGIKRGRSTKTCFCVFFCTSLVKISCLWIQVSQNAKDLWIQINLYYCCKSEELIYLNQVQVKIKTSIYFLL